MNGCESFVVCPRGVNCSLDVERQDLESRDAADAFVQSKYFVACEYDDRVF